MTYLIIGNIIALMASLLMVATGLIKSRSRIIGTQCIMHILFIAANLILGGISGAIANGLSLVRSAVCYKKGAVPLWLKIALVVLQLVLLVIFFEEGWLAFLPVISFIIYTFFLDKGDAAALKLLIISTQLLWVIYDLSIRNYSGFAFDILTIIMNIAGIISLKKTQQ